MTSIHTPAHHPLVLRAARIATAAHAGAVRSCGLPYITHPAAVAHWLAVRGYSPAHVAVGWLHDVVEDTDTTLDDLANDGMPDLVVLGVAAMTRLLGEAYSDAVARAAENEFASQVKWADNGHNSSPEQLACFDHETRQRKAQKYAEARTILRSAA